MDDDEFEIPPRRTDGILEALTGAKRSEGGGIIVEGQLLEGFGREKPTPHPPGTIFEYGANGTMIRTFASKAAAAQAIGVSEGMITSMIALSMEKNGRRYGTRPGPIEAIGEGTELRGQAPWNESNTEASKLTSSPSPKKTPVTGNGDGNVPAAPKPSMAPAAITAMPLTQRKHRSTQPSRVCLPLPPKINLPLVTKRAQSLPPPDNRKEIPMPKGKSPRPVQCVDTGKIYPSRKHAEEEIGYPIGYALSPSGSGKVRGQHWKYAEENRIKNIKPSKVVSRPSAALVASAGTAAPGSIPDIAVVDSAIANLQSELSSLQIARNVILRLRTPA